MASRASITGSRRQVCIWPESSAGTPAASLSADFLLLLTKLLPQLYCLAQGPAAPKPGPDSCLWGWCPDAPSALCYDLPWGAGFCSSGSSP